MKNATSKPRQLTPNNKPVVNARPVLDRDTQQRANRRRNRGNSEPAEWSTADSAKLIAAICAVTQHGYAIRFGYTKDGGAFAVGIIGDGEPFTEFPRPTEDINLYLDGVISDYEK
jgi:hypothetical protein